MSGAPAAETGPPELEDYRAVGSVDEFELDRFRFFEIRGRPVGVVRTSSGFFAVRNVCPHQGAEVCKGRITGAMLPSPPGEFRYGLEGRVLICPWHRWEFDLATGKTLYGLSKQRLVAYEVRVRGDRVYVAETRTRRE